MEIACQSRPPPFVARVAYFKNIPRSMCATGLLCTLLLHGLVLRSMIQGPGATLIKSATEPAEALILVELPSLDMKAQTLMEDLASEGSAPKNLLVTMVSPNPLPHIDISADKLDDNAATNGPVDSGDPTRRALLFGRYSGQIQARIERAWRRPRAPVSEGAPISAAGSPERSSTADDSFRCQVRILQDGHGAVQEVQLLSCNGGVTWQQSLVTAILSASPLPAPPDPAVFTQSLTMTFDGQAYAPEGSADGYEISRVAVDAVIGSLR
jgi:hypothetical protein